jgi:16S rRNA (cytidine1402-2'-O)-methyltransferase
MKHCGIDTPMRAYHDHSSEAEIANLLRKLQEGAAIALISDAGTPLVSDPGYRLIDAALTAGIKVVPVPGSCAAIAALSVAGLPSNRFVFEGFLVAKQQARLNQLQTLRDETRTLIFYEAPHRLLTCLQDMAEVFGETRTVVLAREITKTYETIHRASLADMVTWVGADDNQQRGECVLLLEGAEADHEINAEARRTLEVLLEELPLKKAAALTAKLTGLKKNALYQYGLGLND